MSKILRLNINPRGRDIHRPQNPLYQYVCQERSKRVMPVRRVSRWRNYVHTVTRSQTRFKGEAKLWMRSRFLFRTTKVNLTWRKNTFWNPIHLCLHIWNRVLFPKKQTMAFKRMTLYQLAQKHWKSKGILKLRASLLPQIQRNLLSIHNPTKHLQFRSMAQNPLCHKISNKGIPQTQLHFEILLSHGKKLGTTSKITKKGSHFF
mmetsp:Transcript_11374/g.42696  ORF Transcript_11374/g.42696 Transcript_11374/m.42696 type:complete len:204 (+) Transcript_11374:3483-4094(+)